MSVPITTKTRNADPSIRIPNLPPLLEGFSGTLTFSETVKSLENLFFSHWSLLRVISGTIIWVPEIETKVFLSHCIYMHAEIASALKRRLTELRVRESRLVDIPEPIDLLANELLSCASAGELVHGYCVLIENLQREQNQFTENTDPLLDRPSLQILSRFSADLANSSIWLGRACDGYRAVHPECFHFAEHIRSVSTALRAGRDVADLRQRGRGDFVRTNECARDSRFSLFHESRAYSAEDDNASGADDYTADRLELARTQRDEIDAIETFANVLFDVHAKPFELAEQLARFVEDEARHVEAGHALLAELGHDPFALPCSIIGINVRAPMPPVLAFAQLNIFGELNVVSRLNVLTQRAYARGDDIVGRAFDFVHADELTHVRRGRKILREMAPSESLEELEERAHRLAARRLAEEGVLGEDYALAMSRKEIGDLIGE